MKVNIYVKYSTNINQRQGLYRGKKWKYEFYHAFKDLFGIANWLFSLIKFEIMVFSINSYGCFYCKLFLYRGEGGKMKEFLEFGDFSVIIEENVNYNIFLEYL